MATKRRSRRTPRAGRAAGEGSTGGRQLLDQLAAVGAPPEALRAVQGARDIGEALDRLMSAGLLPAREDVLAGMLAGWRPLLRRGCDPMSAELAGYEFLQTIRGAGAGEVDLPEVLASMIEDAAQAGTPEALAMLRVVAAVGPPPVRPAAAAAADRLVGSGLVDPPWVGPLGRPKVGACFGYTDPLGCQSVLAITFSYGRKQHALAVLIDHVLGGGVKDCYVADRPQRVRAAYQDSADRAGVDLEDHPPAEAAAILESALAAKPCPVLRDQIEDVSIHLDLLRARVALLRDHPCTTSGR